MVMTSCTTMNIVAQSYEAFPVQVEASSFINNINFTIMNYQQVQSSKQGFRRCICVEFLYVEVEIIEILKMSYIWM